MDRDAETISNFFRFLMTENKYRYNVDFISNKLNIEKDFVYNITASRRKSPIPASVMQKIEKIFYLEIVDYEKDMTSRQGEFNKRLSWINTELTIELLNYIKELRTLDEKNQALKKNIEILKRKINQLRK